ncbi:MAG: hypothetical protein IT320_18935 [Anaerolineae bacterium]|nr:hypothetical protein [Anaerolineae bacterium]
MQINTDTLPLLLLLFCVIPTALLIVVTIFILQRAQKLVTPSAEDLRANFARLEAQRPSEPREALVARIIRRQALVSGAIGALTSVGGIVTLPFGLAIDLFTTARIQSATLQFLAWAYGHRDEQAVLQLTEALALRERDVTGYVAAQTPALTQRLIRRITVLVVEKTFAKLIPGIGLIVGFVVNYAIARGTSWLAARWYAAHAGTASR